MAKIISLQTVQSSDGKLSVFERLLPNGIKRVFYIYDQIGQFRGGHRHKDTTHAIICLSGSCKIEVNNGTEKNTYILDSPELCLLLEPNDWREMYDFTEKTILLCISNQYYNPDDYIYTPYPNEKKK